MKKKILITVVIILVAIQFFRPERNTAEGVSQNDITLAYQTSDEVKTILKKACYDCHSNNTMYPWYANIQPVAWWLNDHIKEGKDELNFSEFATYEPGRQYHKLEEVKEMIDEDEMPLASYTFIHTDAKLTDVEKSALLAWSGAIRDTMKAKYPPEALAPKQRKAETQEQK